MQKLFKRDFMSKIRELSFDEIAIVSGGGNSGDHEHQSTGPRNTLGRNAPTHIYSDPATVKCADAVFGGMIGGAIKGGPVGMVRGTIGGAILGQCLSDYGGGGGSAGSSNCSGGDSGSSENCSGGIGATCNR